MTLSQSLLNSPVIPSMARELGIDEQTARTGAAALMPAIVAGLGRSAVGGAGVPGGASALGGGAAGLGGLGGLGSILGGLAGGGAGGGLLNAVLGSQPTPVQHGNDILGGIFGNKDVSRSVASEAAAASGLDQGLLKKMLPILVMAAVGYLMHQGQQQGGASGGGGGIPGMGGAPAGGLGGILGSIVGGLAGRR